MTKFPILIAIIGRTGSGKSSFINAVAGEDIVRVGHGLESKTSDVMAVDIDYKGQKITLVDTPAFDYYGETTVDKEPPPSSADVLRKIAAYMSQTVTDGRKFSGVIYAHSISESRVGRSSVQQMDLLRAICGQDAMKNVTVVTTFWDFLDLPTGVARENDLATKPGPLKQLIDNGAVFARCGRDSVSRVPLSSSPFSTPQSIVDRIIKLDPTTLDFMDDVSTTRILSETRPGILLYNQYEEQVRIDEQRIAQLEQELTLVRVRNQDYEDLIAECNGLREEVERLRAEQQKLKEEPLKKRKRILGGFFSQGFSVGEQERLDVATNDTSQTTVSRSEVFSSTWNTGVKELLNNDNHVEELLDVATNATSEMPVSRSEAFSNTWITGVKESLNNEISAGEQELSGVATNGAPTPLTPSSARMFDQACNLNITGGELYNTAGSLTIDNHDASTHSHSTSVTHLWPHRQACNPIIVKLAINVGERLDDQIQDNPSDNDLPCETKSCLSEDGPTDQGGVCEQCQNDNLLCSPVDTLVDLLPGWNESDLQNQQGQTVQDVTRSTDNTLIDGTIQDILSNYPQPPIGDPCSFQWIIKALIFAFSPLSPTMIAALLGLDNTRHLELILMPASSLIFMPELDDNQTPVKFIDLSTEDFFLDRARSGKYFVDSPLAHRVLLDGCTLVMEKVYREGLRLDKADCQLRYAYEYACRYWEAHRRAGARLKL